MITRLLIFLAINFGALGIGGFFTGKGVPSDWYVNLDKAPWTPPGWMFGFAWTTIMICFSLYLAYLWPKTENKSFLVGVFVVQWILNVMWNPIFFYYHQTLVGLIVISVLAIVVAYFMFNYWSILKLKSLLILPYFIWLLIAISLNAYIVFRN